MFTHQTYIRDIAFDQHGDFYFSEAWGAGNSRKIYQFNLQSKRATLFKTIPLNQIGGFWAGDFAFSPSNQLYVSSGHLVPASLFVHEGGTFRKVFTDQQNTKIYLDLIFVLQL